MRSITVRRLKSALISGLLLISLLSVFSYASAPSTEVFEWISLNPLSTILGMVFTFKWLGLSTLLASLVVILLGLLMWSILFWIISKVSKMR